MAEVMAPSHPAATSNSLSPDSHDTQHTQDSPASRLIGSQRRQQPPDRIPSYAESRMSSYSKRSRPQSTAYQTYPSSLSYALVRDFAYPSFHPMHFGGPPESNSGASTPHSEWNAARRMSDSVEGSSSVGRGTWAAGPWGGDGLMYRDPEQDVEPLPSTSFGSGDDWVEGEPSLKKSKHRKSRSFADVPDYERGRRRESDHRFSDFDPAGRDALRQSRGFQENGEPRRDSHFAAAAAGTLPSRSYHTSQPLDPDIDIPLDAEPSVHSPQRESIGPEDEELFAGPSLALYSFEPENDNELRLTEGQTILVSYRHGQGWLVARDPQTGEQGLVPEQYVRLLRDIEGWDEERGGFIDDEELIGGIGPGIEVSEEPEGLHVVHPSDFKDAPDTTLPIDDGHDHDMKLEQLSLHSK